jgi:hypothetical protein
VPSVRELGFPLVTTPERMATTVHALADPDIRGLAATAAHTIAAAYSPARQREQLLGVYVTAALAADEREHKDRLVRVGGVAVRGGRA